MAAETFAHYADPLGGHVRFDRWMLRDVDTLERAEREGWEDARLAVALEVEVGQVLRWRRAYQPIDPPTSLNGDALE